jgi:hypothetical protein
LPDKFFHEPTNLFQILELRWDRESIVDVS